MNIFIVLLFYLLLSLTFTILFKEKFEKTFLFSLFSSTIVMYLSQYIFKTFNFGFYILIIFALLSIPLLVYNYKNKKLSELKKLYFTKSFIYIIAFFIIVFIFDYDRMFSKWDEFSHWGKMVKEMFRLDSFYSTKLSNLMVHKDYPPIIQIYELLWVKLSNSYSETILIKSIHFLELSLLIIPISYIDIKNKICRIFSYIFYPLLFFLVTLFFDGHGIINTIYVDYIMALVTATSLFMILSYRKYNRFDAIIFVLINTFLILIKQMSIPLYLIIIFFLITKLIIINKEEIFKYKFNFIKNNKKQLIYLLLIICIPFLINYSWSHYINKLDLEKQFVISDIEVKKLYNIGLKKEGQEWQQIAFDNYIKALSNNPVTTNFNLGFIQCIVLSIIILTFLIKNNYKKHDRYLLLISVIIGAIGYAFVMLNLYVFCFGSAEGPSLASYNRYMATYILIIFFVAIMVYIQYYSKDIYKNLLVLLVCLLIQNSNYLINSYPSFISKKLDMKNYYNHAINIKKIDKNNNKIFLISQNTVGDYQFFVNYYLTNSIINKDNYSFDTSEEVNSKDYYEKTIKPYLKDYDYVYIANIDDKFKEKYSYIFEPDDLKSQAIYKIKKEDNNLKFKLLK